MANILMSPQKYVQGRGELDRLGSYVSPFGSHPMVLLSPAGEKRFGERIQKSFLGEGITPVLEQFRGECSMEEIDRVLSEVTARSCDVIIGLGGGKAIDTAKCVANRRGIPVIIVPTAASTDAPCSAVAVVYTPSGVVDHGERFAAGPNVVLVDSDVIAKAPARLLVSGMGDALATYFEARACKASNGLNSPKGSSTLSAQALAKLCYEVLRQDGLHAKLAVERGVCTPAVERVIEANTYLSGIGFESGGLSIAHAIHDGLTHLSQTHALYHGEKVAYGTLVQLALEPGGELDEVLDFCRSVGLPTTLSDLCLGDAGEAELRAAAGVAAKRSNAHNEPFPVDEEMLLGAMLLVDALGSKNR